MRKRMESICSGLGVGMLAALVLTACGASKPPETSTPEAAAAPSAEGAENAGAPDPATNAGPAECGPGHQRVASQSDCLQDDAVCYRLADDAWCTGPKAAECPAGTQQVASQSDCPQDVRCFQVSESAWCSGG